MRWLASALAATTVLGTAGWARAAENEWDGSYDLVAEKRSDFVLGGSFGGLVAQSYGYPNEADKIDESAWVADTGVGGGMQWSAWIGGALRDWFTFGLGITSLSYSGNGLDATATGFIVRVEAFPLWAYGGLWRDAGLYASLGIGGMKLERDGETAADGGAISIVGVGAFWEPLRFGSFAFGPSFEFDHYFSRTIRLYGASASARLVLYTGP